MDDSLRGVSNEHIIGSNMFTNRWNLALFAIAVLAAARANAATCESLASLTLPETTVTSAQTVAAGAFSMPGGGFMPMPVSPKSLPAFCRVAATLRPSKDSDIKIEVWLPVSGWNGKFQARGQRRLGRVISYPALWRRFARGYAAASTDTGHAARQRQLRSGPSREGDRLWLSRGA